VKNLGLTSTQREAYRERIFSTHDYRVNATLLTLEEKPVGDLSVLDGQINFQTGNGVRRTATLTISDPAGALDFTGAQMYSGSTVWLDRLVRITHSIKVPGYGINLGHGADVVQVTCFIGPPSTISRDGAEVTLELQDKAALAMRGSKPYTVPKGMNARTAIRNILANCAGEFRFKLGTGTRRLSKPYSVGWDDTASPWAVAYRIASAELGMRLYYTTDGYAALRKVPTASSFTVPHVLDQAATSMDFTTVDNIVQVTGKQATSTKDAAKGSGLPKGTTITKTTQPRATAQLPASNPLSPQALARKGVPRYLPLLVSDDSITKTSQAKTRAANELGKDDRLQGQPQYDVIPFFHGDVDDLVNIRTPTGLHTVRLSTVSIPLGVGGPMTIGTQRWVSRAPRLNVKAWQVRTRTVHKPKPKPKKTAAKHHGKRGRG